MQAMQANTRQLATEKPRLQQRYETQVVPALQKELGIENVMAVPKVLKVVINVGAGEASRDPKILDVVVDTLTRITGQKPVIAKARKSISNFKIRKGMGIGAMVTLRGRRMYDFLDRLINVSLPRVRDFHGLSTKSFDRQGNYSLAFREHNVFPEIPGDAIEKFHGLEVTICSSSTTPKEAEALLRHLGFPLQSS